MKKIRIYIFIAISIVSISSVLAQPNKQLELEEKRETLLQEIKQINSLLFKTQGKKKSILTDVEDLNHRINAREVLLK
jgi:hypothetical protein